jgi:hypothetical protein
MMIDISDRSTKISRHDTQTYFVNISSFGVTGAGRHNHWACRVADPEQSNCVWKTASCSAELPLIVVAGLIRLRRHPAQIDGPPGV